MLVGAGTFVGIGLQAKEKQEWLRRYLRLVEGIPSHDSSGPLFVQTDPIQFEAAFRQWVSSYFLVDRTTQIQALDDAPWEIAIGWVLNSANC